jgi:type II secretory pathway component PulF
MNPFKITYYDNSGLVRSFSIDAKDEADALRASPIPQHNIISIHVDYLSYLRFFSGGNKKIKLQKQSLYLQSIASIIDSGLSVRYAFENIFLGNSDFSFNELTFKNCENLSDFVTLINFHPSVISIASVADSTGDLVNSLEMASEFCDSLAKSEEEFMSSLIKSSIYIVLALIFLVGAPFIEGNILYEMVYVDKNPLPLNLASHLLIDSVKFYETYGWMIIVLIVVVFFNRSMLFEKVKNLWFFKLVHRLLCVNRSFVFLSVYRMMLFSGVTPIKIVHQMYGHAKGRDRLIYKKMIELLEQGVSIGNTIDTEEWSDEVLYSLKDSDTKTEESLEKTFNASRKSIMANQKDAGRDIGVVCIWTGMLSIAFVIAIIFIGFFIPIYAQRISF